MTRWYIFVSSKLIFIEKNFHFQEYEAIYLAKLQTPTDHSSGKIYLLSVSVSFDYQSILHTILYIYNTIKYKYNT